MKSYKEKIAENFSDSSGSYDQHAVVQKRSIGTLARLVAEADKQIPEGPVIEVGCGTGSLSSSIIDLMPGREVILADIAPGMIEICKSKLSKSNQNLDRVQWIVMDAESMVDNKKYALIVSGLTVQWFEDIDKSLARFIKALQPGGRLICSFFGQDSFPEWRKICSDLNIPCTANLLPSSKEVIRNLSKANEVKSWTDFLPIKYSSAKEFFLSLKKTGANTSANNQPVLTAGQMKKIFEHWGGEHTDISVTVTYSINYLVLIKK